DEERRKPALARSEEWLPQMAQDIREQREKIQAAEAKLAKNDAYARALEAAARLSTELIESSPIGKETADLAATFLLARGDRYPVKAPLDVAHAALSDAIRLCRIPLLAVVDGVSTEGLTPYATFAMRTVDLGYDSQNPDAVRMYTFHEVAHFLELL